jgi:hypothetical protein
LRSREQRIENRRRRKRGRRSAQSVENRGIPILQKTALNPWFLADALIQTPSSAALLNGFHDSSRATAFERSLWKTRGHPVDVIEVDRPFSYAAIRRSKPLQS